MAQNDTISIDLPAHIFFQLVARGMYYEMLDTSKIMKDRKIEDVVITDDGYRVVYGTPVEAESET